MGKLRKGEGGLGGGGRVLEMESTVVNLLLIPI